MAEARVNVFKAKQLQEYGEDSLKYVSESTLLSKYIARKGNKSESSAQIIRSRINRFGLFAFKTFPDIVTFDAYCLGIYCVE